MAPSKAPSSWEEEEEDSTPPSSPPVIARRNNKFEDEEDDSSDVVEDWADEEDSEAEREKAKKAAEAKAKAEAEAKAAHKSRSQRIEERRQQHLKEKADMFDEESSEEEDEAEQRARARASEKQSDLQHAEDLFSGIGGVNPNRASKPVTVIRDDNPGEAIDLSSLSLFRPSSVAQFAKLKETLVPLLTANAKKPQYAVFLPDFVKQISKDLNSEQMKKVAAGLNTMANEKMKEEKAAEKGGKKTKAAKTKTSLVANRDISKVADTAAYDDGLDDGDFM